MRLNLPRFLLLLQFYFHIAHEALLSHTHFTFYCCTPVNLLKPSHSSFAGCARANLRSTIATAHCFKILQYAAAVRSFVRGEGFQVKYGRMRGVAQAGGAVLEEARGRCFGGGEGHRTGEGRGGEAGAGHLPKCNSFSMSECEAQHCCSVAAVASVFWRQITTQLNGSKIISLSPWPHPLPVADDDDMPHTMCVSAANAGACVSHVQILHPRHNAPSSHP